MSSRHHHIGGYVQLQRVAIDRLRPLPGNDPGGRRLTWHQLGILTALSATIGRHDTIVRHGDGKGPPMTISDIADMIGCTRQAASRTLHALEQAGAVKMAGNTSDRHVVIEPHVAHRYARRSRQ